MNHVDLSDIGWMTEAQLEGLASMYKNMIEIETIKHNARLDSRDLAPHEEDKIAKLTYRNMFVMYNILIAKVRYLQSHKTKSFYDKIV